MRLAKQHRQLSYQELAFHLEDSASFRAFARRPWSWSPRKSVLHKTISAIRAETWNNQSRTMARRRALAADGGFATRANLSQAKARGVRDLAFHKKRGLQIEDMVTSRWVYRKLRNFRAGIEADISCLKRAYGLARCTWRGLSHFKAYVWSSVVAYHLALFARLKPA